MTSQQIGDTALAIYQSSRDDQARMDRMLREFFSDVRETEREEEFKRQLRCVSEQMSCPEISTSPSSLPSLAASSLGA
jgi:hypothetical protein